MDSAAYPAQMIFIGCGGLGFTAVKRARRLRGGVFAQTEHPATGA